LRDAMPKACFQHDPPTQSRGFRFEEISPTSTNRKHAYIEDVEGQLRGLKCKRESE